ncbi:MAG: xylose isomerase [Trueperaceae bacterium]|jgi:sugar phosphate isomerase/epimerase|nr:xylose isomerase [Trueperaceae bacterium]|tara:strand:+ start:88 stop:864 length:777 start_codon:yes stop_codon:yes gene_type:complete
MPNKVLAAQLFTVRDYTQTPKDIAETLRKIAAIGYKSVQISQFGAIDPHEVKSLLDEHGLSCGATHISYERLKDDLQAVIAEHQLWGCRHVAIGSMPSAFRESGVDGVRNFATEANEIGFRLNQAGLTFSYHNHSFEFLRVNGRSLFEMLFEELDPRYVFSELDTYWIQHGGGDPAAWIKALSSRIPVIHLKDMVIHQNGQQIMAEVGEGNLNWPAILDACRSSGTEIYAVEQDICQRDPFESLAISYRNLQAMGLKK